MRLASTAASCVGAWHSVASAPPASATPCTAVAYALIASLTAAEVPHPTSAHIATARNPLIMIVLLQRLRRRSRAFADKRHRSKMLPSDFVARRRLMEWRG